MDMRALARRAFEADVRIGQIHFLPLEIHQGGVSDELEEVLGDLDTDDLVRLFGRGVLESSVDPVLGPDTDEVIEWMQEQELDGVMVRFESAVHRYAPNGRSYSYRWGHYRIRWFHAETLEAAVEQGFTWAADVDEQDRSKAAGEGGHA